MGIADHWNTRAEDLEGEWACDRFSKGTVAALYRAVEVEAPATILWRWVCQLRLAPYSYDWIDNGGRRSPAQLTPRLDQIAIGDSVMRMFRVVGFVPEDHLTLETAGLLGLGPLHVTYRLRERGPRTRLAVKLAIATRPGWLGAVLLRGLASGDLIMMRKQLLTLKAYAEGSAREESAA